MPIPMVADCSDYETFRSGRYIPGIMGTLFSLVDKLVSSLGSTVVGAAVAMIGIHTLPDGNTPYSDGMHGVVDRSVLYCSDDRMDHDFDCDEGVFPDRQPNERNSGSQCSSKDAINRGMSLEDAMQTWKEMDQVPEKFRQS